MKYRTKMQSIRANSLVKLLFFAVFHRCLRNGLKSALLYGHRRTKVGEKSRGGGIHRYILFSYTVVPPHNGNIGDNIQTIAVKRAVSRIDERAEFIVVPRDELAFYENRPLAICVMQGWFEHEVLDFLPGADVVPVWLGTHWQNSTRVGLCCLLKLYPDVFRGVEVGCRDKSTLEFCKELGIPAYFSRCLTLTLPRREAEPKNPRIFVVSCPDWVVFLLPQDVKGNAVFVDQREICLTYEKDKMWLYDEKAKEFLTRYRNEAGLVVTSALHCAQPCLAMGIPVVFIDPNESETDEADRFSAMQGITPIWRKEDLENGRVNFSPKVAEIEDLKALMVENLDLSIRKAKGIPFDSEHLLKVRQKIEDFSIV